MNDFCQILEVSPNATIKEIKDAYRKKAGRIHPDVNPSPTAHEDFITLTEAYESMLRGKTGRVYNETSRNYTRASSAHSEADLREQARERARRAAQMKYQEFIHSDYYKSKMSQYKIIEFWGSLILFLPVFMLQLLFFSYMETNYIFSGIAMSVISGPLLFNFIKIIKETTLSHLFKDTIMVIKTDVFSTFAVVIFNIIVFVNVGFVVFIPMKIILIIYLVIPIVIQIFREIAKISANEKVEIRFPSFLLPLSQKVANLKRPFFSIWGAIPIAFSLLLLINVSISYNSKTEILKYYINYSESDVVMFEDQRYNKYWGVCYFNLGKDIIEFNNTITLKKEIGLFGIPYIDDYAFSKREYSNYRK